MPGLNQSNREIQEEELKIINIKKVEMENPKINSFYEENPKMKSVIGTNRAVETEAAYLKKDYLSKQKNYLNSLDLKWEDITISTLVQSKCCGKNIVPPKKLLANVSGSVKTGEALAIIGGSGAGKTTLLNFLSKKIETKNLSYSGRVSLNDIEILSGETNYKNNYFIPSDLEAISTYVMQDDIIEALMTPLENFLFTAKLKLHMPEIEIEKRVNKLIKELNLENCKNTKIGNNIIRGVSGGERKRTSIGMELISDPKIIFLDEPTTGLDSYNAYEVIDSLCQLAEKEEKIVIFTIHQPSSEIFSLLHKIFILADGRTVFFGDSSKAINFFNDNLCLNYPGNYNPFEYFIEMTNFEVLNNQKIKGITAYGKILNEIDMTNDKSKQQGYSSYIELLSEIFAGRKKLILDEKKNYLAMDLNSNTNQKISSDEYTKLSGKSEESVKEYLDKIISEKKLSKGFCYEFSSLMGRGMILALRNPNQLIMRIISNLFTAFFIAILFKNLSKNYAGIQDRAGAIFLLIVSSILGTTSSTILTFSEEKKVFLRERSNKMYSVISYYSSKLIGQFPLIFIPYSIFLTVIYPSINLNDTYSYKYFSFIGLIFLCCLCGVSYAFFLGSLVSNSEALTNINTMFTIPLMILSGFFAASNNFAPYLIPFEYISGFKYGFQLFMNIEFTDMQPLNCNYKSPEPCDPLKNNYTFKEANWVSFLCLASVIIFFQIMAFILIYTKSKMKG